MRALTAQQLLAVWESGQGQSPTDQALALLAAACPTDSPGSLAELSVGRRDAQLLLERMDVDGVTRRIGDRRVLRRGRASGREA